MAVNCSVVWLRMVGFVGVTAIDISVAGVTVNVTPGDVRPLTGSVAVMTVVPVASELALPFVPTALPMVAVAWVAEPQVTDAVMFCVELSVYVPVALN